MTSRRRIVRAVQAIRTIWSIMGLTLVAVVLLEVFLGLVFTLKDHFYAAQVPDGRVVTEGYGGQAWPIRHYRELGELQDRWQPYVYFRQRPYSGLTILIDQDGHRKTWRPAQSPSSGTETKAYRILMLGGSSLWGFGARDDFTIPSLIARKLDLARSRIELRNLSEIGYVSTQEVVALLRELQTGYRPDLVVFYDGVNDTTSALLEGEAGVTTNERNRRKEFNIRQSPARLCGAMVAKVVQDSASYRLAQVIARRLTGVGGMAGSLPAADRRKELVSAVVRQYAANLEIVDRLGRGFGFEALYYWQPVVFEKRSLTPYESEEATKFGWSREFLADVYQAIRSSTKLKAEPRFHDLGRLFADSKDLVFIDYCHTTESANEQIAQVVARDILESLRSRRRDSNGGDLPTQLVR